MTMKRSASISLLLSSASWSLDCSLRTLNTSAAICSVSRITLVKYSLHPASVMDAATRLQRRALKINTTISALPEPIGNKLEEAATATNRSARTRRIGGTIHLIALPLLTFSTFLSAPLLVFSKPAISLRKSSSFITYLTSDPRSTRRLRRAAFSSSVFYRLELDARLLLCSHPH